jgi:predicted Rossmann fold flavoprotein
MRGAYRPLTVEQGQRVFPTSGRSSDILKALERELTDFGVQVHLGCGIRSVQIDNGSVTAVVDAAGRRMPCSALVVAAGGITYPATGSTGDGYKIARQAGHTVSDPRPALVPVEVREQWVPTLQGLTLKNVSLRIRKGKKVLMDEVGELLFAHFGVTGPLILKATGLWDEATLREAEVSIDLKPGMTAEMVDSRLERELRERPGAHLGNTLRTMLPQRLVDVVLDLARVDAATSTSAVTRAQRLAVGAVLKGLPLTITAFRPPEEAVITRGGVCCREVDPSTMASKLVKGLYFAGEVMDVDAYTGGFNLTIAFSTGYTAGNI